jgi:protein ImuB
MSAAEERDRRVLVVRCPAWGPGGGSPDRGAGSGGSAGRDDPAGPDARAFEQVIGVVQEFCPRIEVVRPGICAFGARGPAGYFGGETGLAGKIGESVARLGLDCGIGVADGMFAALLASRDALTRGPGGPEPDQPEPGRDAVIIVPPGGTPAYLAPRAVTVLGELELAGLLVRLGIRTVGEFAALPTSQAANRFGPQGALAHRLARGLDPRPLVASPPEADLSVHIEFDPPAERSEQVVFAAKSLAGQMHDRLAASGLSCVRVRVEVGGADGREITRVWRHDGLLSDLAVAERVRWQLDGWQAAGGIAVLRLIPDQLSRAQGRQLGLWGDAVVSDRVARAAIRVQAMLGHNAVRQPVLGGGRSPAEQSVLVPFGEIRTPRLPAGRPWPGRIPAPAPATVYPAPRPARVTDDSGALVTVTGRGLVSAGPARLCVDDGPPLAVTAWTGPWPVTERWWDAEHACRKARFQLVTMDGNAWLAVVQDGRWLIEASYD